MLQALIIKWALDAIIDLVIDVAAEQVKSTDNDIDDNFVAQLERNKAVIKDGIRRKPR